MVAWRITHFQFPSDRRETHGMYLAEEGAVRNVEVRHTILLPLLCVEADNFEKRFHNYKEGKKQH